MILLIVSLCNFACVNYLDYFSNLLLFLFIIRLLHISTNVILSEQRTERYSLIVAGIGYLPA